MLYSFRQIDRHQKTLERHEKQRTRDAEMLRTVAENLHRALYTNESITSDMRRETETLQKEEDGLRVSLWNFLPVLRILLSL